MIKINAKIDGLTVYGNANTGNLKIGSKAAATPVEIVLGRVPKGQGRQIRKALRAAGMTALAAARRAA